MRKKNQQGKMHSKKISHSACTCTGNFKQKRRNSIRNLIEK